MQHVENDMDDLFKRAGENYPLQSDKGDWESIARRINDNSKDAVVMPALNKKRSKKLIVLALLLFILSAGSYRVFVNTNKIPSGFTRNDLSKKVNIKPGKAEGINNNAGFLVEKKALSNATYKHSDNNGTKKNISPFSNKPLTINTRTLNHYIFSKLPEKNSINLTPDQVTLIETKNNSTSYTILKGQKSNDIVAHEIAGNLNPDKNTSLDKTAAVTIELKQGEINDISTAKNKKDASAGILQKKKSIYIGLIVGPDFSKVKKRSYGSGFDAGLLLGYRLSKKLSFESGFFLNKKRYSSEGRDFSMVKVSSAMPNGMIINSLEGKSSLIEIPVKVKYDFQSEKRSTLFVAGGVSSYIVTREKNMYSVTLNGSQDKFTGVYKKNGYGIPAVATISLGYEYNVSGYINIRLEPYLKLPIQGIGVGSLPVTSAGFQVGIVSRLK